MCFSLFDRTRVAPCFRIVSHYGHGQLHNYLHFLFCAFPFLDFNESLQGDKGFIYVHVCIWTVYTCIHIHNSTFSLVLTEHFLSNLQWLHILFLLIHSPLSLTGQDVFEINKRSHQSSLFVTCPLIHCAGTKIYIIRIHFRGGLTFSMNCPTGYLTRLLQLSLQIMFNPTMYKKQF